MNTSPLCPECGKPVPADSQHQVCPACLLAQALASRTIVDGGNQAPVSPPPSPEEIADKFPGFEILECLGRGGMGVVYKARQKSLNRLVAIKILPPECAGQEKFSERFAIEAQTLARLNHQNIVSVFDFGEAAGLFYIVMEFVDGVNLRDLLRDGKLEPKQALAIVPPICDALQYAHDKGIVHRDIKPENLLLDRDGRIKIADFGIAKLIGASGDLAGTPPYMAPEQSGAKPEVDHRADIYALGVVLYEMLTGERPDRELVAPSRKVQIDVRLDEMVLRALEKEPERRYQTAGEFRTVVETMAGAQPGISAPVQPQLLRSGECLYATPEFLATVWGAMKLHQGMGALLLYSDRLEFQAGLLRTVIPLGSVRRLDLIRYPFFQSPAGLRSIEMEFEEAGTPRHLVLTPSRGTFSFVGTKNGQVFEWLGAIREAIRNATGSPPAGSSSPIPYQGFSADGRLVSAFAMLASFTALLGFLTALAMTGSWRNILPAAVPFIFGVSFVLALAWRQRRQWQREHPLPEGVDAQEGRTGQVSGGRRMERTAGQWIAIGCGVLLLGMLMLAMVSSLLFWFLNSTPHDNAGRETPLPRQETSNASQLSQEGWQLWQAGKPTEARSKFEQAVKLAPGDANAWNGLGWSCFNSGDAKEAEQAFQKVIELQPDHPAALNGLGQIHLSQRKYESAEGFLLKAAEQKATAAWYGLARLYLLQEKFDQAEKWARMLVDAGQADEMAKKMLEAAKAKNLPEGLKMMIEPPQSAGQLDEPTFGPVVEREQPFAEAFDPEAGTSWPSPFRPLGGSEDQVRSGLQFSVNAERNELALGGMAGFAPQLSNTDQWESIINHQAFDTLRNKFIPDDATVFAVAPAQPPQTFLFKTPAGRMGILQVTGFTENPRGVKIRYKLVMERNAPTTPANRLAGNTAERHSIKTINAINDANRFLDLELAVIDAKASGMGDKHPSVIVASDVLARFKETHPNTPDSVWRQVVGQRLDKAKEDLAALSAGGLGKVHPTVVAQQARIRTLAELVGKPVVTEAKETAPPENQSDKILIEDLALHMIVAIREKDDAKLKALATDRIKGWRDALPVFAVELREHYRQSTGNEAFDLRASESLVDGNLAVVRCTGPAELKGKCLALYFVKTNDGWRNHSLRATTEDVPLPGLMEVLKKQIHQVQDAAAPNAEAPKVPAAGTPEKAVANRAEAWLAGIDAGNYAQSWKDAAKFFQAAITEAAWSEALTKVRKPLGALKSRKLLNAQSAKSLPGAPDGEYVVMQFDTSFAAKEKAVETVTFMLEPDGTWKAAGYFIR